jgi:hypothetical protein
MVLKLLDTSEMALLFFMHVSIRNRQRSALSKIEDL